MFGVDVHDYDDDDDNNACANGFLGLFGLDNDGDDGDDGDDDDDAAAQMGFLVCLRH